MALTVKASNNEQDHTPHFRESDAVCIEAPPVLTHHQSKPKSLLSAQDRLAQLNYFAQSISQAMPAARVSPSHHSRYAIHSSGFSLRV